MGEPHLTCLNEKWFSATYASTKLWKNQIREEKRWLRHENGLNNFSLLAAKLISLPRCKVGQNTTPTRHKIPQSESENIRESIIDFTTFFGEINPGMPYLCRRDQSGPQKAIFVTSQ